MQGRHLDQLIMCSLYGIARVQEEQLQFKDIINKYKNMPQHDAKVYRNCLLESGEQGNIITFYNNIFMQRFKDYMLNWVWSL